MASQLWVLMGTIKCHKQASKRQKAESAFIYVFTSRILLEGMYRSTRIVFLYILCLHAFSVNNFMQNVSALEAVMHVHDDIMHS